MRGTGADTCDTARHGAAGVIVQMDTHAHRRSEMRAHFLHRRRNFPRQMPAVGIAQYEGFCAAFVRSTERLERVVGVLIEAVEEMLGVVDHALPLRAQVSDGVLDHLKIFLKRRAEHFLYLEHGRLAENTAYLRASGHERLHARVFLGFQFGPTRRAERHDLRGLPRFLAREFEERGVLRIRARPAALNKRHSEFVELARDTQLVVSGIRNAFRLRAIAQGRVEHFDVRAAVGLAHEVTSVGVSVFCGCCARPLDWRESTWLSEAM